MGTTTSDDLAAMERDPWHKRLGFGAVLCCVALGYVAARIARDSRAVPLAVLPVALAVAANWFACVSPFWPAIWHPR